MAAMQNLGKAIRNLRKARGLKQADLAKLSGVSTVTISQIENGITNPSIGTIETLAEALNTSVPALYLSMPMKTRRTDEGLKKLVGTNVRTRREFLDLTRKQAAERVGLLPQYFATTENFNRLPKLGSLIRIARSLEVQPSWLLEDQFDVHRSISKGSAYLDVKQVIGRIQDEREKQNLTISQAAKLADWSTAQWYKLENNRRDVSALAAQDVCRALRIRLTRLLDY